MKVANTVDLKNKTNELLRQVMNGEALIITYRGKPVASLTAFSEKISRTLFWSTVGRLARSWPRRRRIARPAACFPWKPISPAVDRDAVTDDLRTLAERPTGAPPRVQRLT